MSAHPSLTSSLKTARIASLSAAAYSGMFVFGIVMALLGAILPSLVGHLPLGTTDVGTIFLAMNGAMLASSLVLGLVMDRFGMKPPLALGSLLVAGALLIVVRAAGLSALYSAVVLLGAGGGALNGSTNTLIADLHEDSRQKTAALNRLGVFFGFGALFLPFTLGTLLIWFSVPPLLIGAALLCTAAGAFAALLRFPSPKQKQRMPVAEMLRFLRSPLVLAFACLLFFESGVEFTLGGFISLYLMRDMGVASVPVASWVLAGYWASIMISRAMLSRMALRTDAYSMLALCSLGACAAAVLAALAPAASVSALAIVICGLSLAGIYPSALGIAGSRFESHSGTVFGILFAVALAGGMLVPWLAGHVGALAGLRWVFGIVAFAFAAVFILSRVAARFDQKYAAKPLSY